MATIEDLDVTSISEMSDEELIEALRTTRQARRTVSRAPRKGKGKPKKPASKTHTKSAVKQDKASLLAVIKALEESIGK